MKTLLKTLLLTVAASLCSVPMHAASIDTKGQPTIGNPLSKVQVVALLEPKCPDSKKYNNNSFPKLMKDYIDTNKISYTVITTSFLYESMHAAQALLCVYNQGGAPRTDLFFKFLNYIYKEQPPEKDNWATIPVLLAFAANASPEIDQDKLKKCLDDETFRKQVEDNTRYGNKLMGELHTPTIFVNGVKIENTDDTIDYGKLSAAIDKSL